MTRITRRLALGIFGLGGASALAYGGSLAACRFVPRNRPDFFALLEVVPDDASARRLGAAYLAERPSHGFDLLVDRLLGRPLIGQALALDCPKSRRDLVREQCRADFCEGRHLEVEGMIVSETEAMLCSAAVFTRGAA